MGTKAYDMDDMQHGDCSFMECNRIIKNGISEKYLEPRNFEWIDADGYTCSTWRIVYKNQTNEQKGMTLEEAKEYIAGRYNETLFGYDVKEFLQKQYK